jgi:16S rRNA (guanine966-N2)-methyltransferase
VGAGKEEAAPAMSARRRSPSPPSGGIGKLRILGGLWRGRVLAAPADRSVRPTAQRTREMIFNRLMHGFVGEEFALPEARVVDVCAGSGAMGLEALSRGAAHITFIEPGTPALALLRQNIAALDVDDRTTVLAADARALPRASRPCDLALLDPPYHENLVAPILTSLRDQRWVRPGALVVIETEAGEDIPETPGFAPIDRRTIGRAAVTTLRTL